MTTQIKNFDILISHDKTVSCTALCDLGVICRLCTNNEPSASTGASVHHFVGAPGRIDTRLQKERCGRIRGDTSIPPTPALSTVSQIQILHTCWPVKYVVLLQIILFSSV